MGAAYKFFTGQVQLTYDSQLDVNQPFWYNWVWYNDIVWCHDCFDPEKLTSDDGSYVCADGFFDEGVSIHFSIR